MSGSGGHATPPSRGNGVQGADPQGLVAEGGPGRRQTVAPGGGSPRDLEGAWATAAAGEAKVAR